MPITLADIQTLGKQMTTRVGKSLLLVSINPDTTEEERVANFGSVLSYMYKIAPSVTSSNLSLAIQHLDGSSPRANNPLAFKISNSWYLLSSTASFTKNAGTNWCNIGDILTNKDVDLFVYAIAETGASAGLKFGFSRYPGSTTMGDFVNTTTHAKYIAGNWTNFNSTDAVEIIGRFNIALTGSTAYQWYFPATQIVIHRPIYFTRWLAWLPSYSASGAMTYTTVTTNVAVYRLEGDTLDFQIDSTGTTGGTVANSIYATLPFDCISAASPVPFASNVYNGSATEAGLAFLVSATPDYVSHRRHVGSDWSLGSGRVIRSAGIYRI